MPASEGRPGDRGTTYINAPSVASPAELSEFHREGSQTVDIPQPDFSEGNRHQPSSRYDLVQRGVASEPMYVPETMPRYEAGSENQEAYLEPEQAQPEPDFRQKYGQSENEKGEYRRMAEVERQRADQLTQQIMEINNRLMSQPVQYQQPMPSGPPPRIWPNKQPGELMTWEEQEQVSYEMINYVQSQIAQNSLRVKDEAVAEAQKMLPSWDIGPLEESQAIAGLRGQFQGFDQRFTAVEKNKMIAREVVALRASSASASPAVPVRPIATAIGRVGNGAPTNTVYVNPTSVIRKQTYVESAAPSQVNNEPTEPINRDKAVAAEMAALDAQAKAAGKGRATADQMQAVMDKYFGFKHVNDWGPGDVAIR